MLNEKTIPVINLRTNPFPEASKIYIERDTLATASEVLPLNQQFISMGAFSDELRSVAPPLINYATLTYGYVRAKDNQQVYGLKVSYPDASQLQLAWWRSNDDRDSTKRVTITCLKKQANEPPRPIQFYLGVGTVKPDRLLFAFPQVLDRIFSHLASKTLATQPNAEAGQRMVKEFFHNLRTIGDALFAASPESVTCHVTRYGTGARANYQAEISFPDGSSVIIDAPQKRLSGKGTVRAMNNEGFAVNAEFFLPSSWRSGETRLRQLLELASGCDRSEMFMTKLIRKFDSNSFTSSPFNFMTQAVTIAFSDQKAKNEILKRCSIEGGYSTPESLLLYDNC